MHSADTRTFSFANFNPAKMGTPGVPSLPDSTPEKSVGKVLSAKNSDRFRESRRKWQLELLQILFLKISLQKNAFLFLVGAVCRVSCLCGVLRRRECLCARRAYKRRRSPRPCQFHLKRNRTEQAPKPRTTITSKVMKSIDQSIC